MRMHSPILLAPRASARSRGGAPVRLIVTAVMLGMWLPATASAADAAAAGRASGPATALESVSLTLSSGRPLTVWLRVPEAAAQAPMPAAVVLGGFETGGGVLDLVPLEHPAILATFDYPYEAPRKLGLLSLFAELDRFRQGVDDTIEAVVRLHDLLAARADVDATRISVVGASAGAPFATIGGQAAGYAGVVIVQGYGQIGTVIGHQFALRWTRDYGAWARWPAAALGHFVVWWLELPSPEDAARQFGPGQQVYMLDSAADARIPAPTADALWAAIAASQAEGTREQIAGGHLGGDDNDEILARVLERCTGWLRASGLL